MTLNLGFGIWDLGFGFNWKLDIGIWDFGFGFGICLGFRILDLDFPMGSFLKQYMWIANIVVILFCSYFAARITNVYIGRALEVHRAIGVMKKAEEKPPTIIESRPRGDFDIIVERNIFDSSEVQGPGPGPGAVSRPGQCDPNAEPVATSLGIKLLAVLVVGEGKDKRSSATVSSGNEVGVYAVGGEEKFSPDTELLQVRPDRIIFRGKNCMEFAKLGESEAASIFGPPTDKLASKEPAKGATEVRKDAESTVNMQDGKVQIDQREIESALNNINQLFTEIRAVPNWENGKVNGMKVLSIKPGSVFAKLGLKRGDILSRINGIELDVKQGFDTFTKLKDQKAFTLDLVRGGKTETIEYEVR